jgi:hypothetical protein
MIAVLKRRRRTTRSPWERVPVRTLVDYGVSPLSTQMS